MWCEVEARGKRICGCFEALLARAQDRGESSGLQELQNLLEEGNHEVSGWNPALSKPEPHLNLPPGGPCCTKATNAMRQTAAGVRHDMDEIFANDHKVVMWLLTLTSTLT